MLSVLFTEERSSKVVRQQNHVSLTLCCGACMQWCVESLKESMNADNVYGFLQMSCVMMGLPHSKISSKQLGM